MQCQSLAYLFMGDYVDRGRQNIDNYPHILLQDQNFLMLRGNCECPAINAVYGECNRRYKSTRLWQVFNVASSRCTEVSLQLNSLYQLRNMPRPQDPLNPSMGIDLLWSDPDPWVKGWQANTRGTSKKATAKAVRMAMQQAGLPTTQSNREKNRNITNDIDMINEY
ncbi:hypothetical protein PRIPAC_83881, partial [Pristionchus pacificus]|uniref:Calcineurin-like phosphoesterase n=1 Tax=Pristionchus pacificus TaxID=54126 RepID=A0A2A6BKZ5_PRIPA